MKLDQRFIDPDDYGQRRLSNIPGTIISLLTGAGRTDILPEDVFSPDCKTIGRVVLFLVDGLTVDLFKRYSASRKPVKDPDGRGSYVTMITQFPSTTACNVTTINTALDVASHGMFEWFYYEPMVDDVIVPLLYSHAREQKERDTLKRIDHVAPADIFPRHTIYQELKKHGVNSYAFQYIEYAKSSFSDVVFTGAEVMGYRTLSHGLASLADTFLKEEGKSYYYFYFDKIDSLSHHLGPASKYLEAELDTFFIALERLFLDRVKDKAKDTLFIITADHGQTAIDLSRTVYLNIAFPGIEKYMKTTRKGRPIVPAGSCRDMFLYIKDEHIDYVISLLQNGLGDRALVCRTSALIESGYLGKVEISPEFRSRLGNVVILPFKGESVWWYEKGVFELTFCGHHGGLTEEEMEIPFFSWCY